MSLLKKCFLLIITFVFFLYSEKSFATECMNDNSFERVIIHCEDDKCINGFKVITSPAFGCNVKYTVSGISIKNLELIEHRFSSDKHLNGVYQFVNGTFVTLDFITLNNAKIYWKTKSITQNIKITSILILDKILLFALLMVLWRSVFLFFRAFSSEQQNKKSNYVEQQVIIQLIASVPMAFNSYFYELTFFSGFIFFLIPLIWILELSFLIYYASLSKFKKKL